LDWVVMRALEKDRDRRYESASAFAADVQRYLRDEPVQACPPSAGYRLRKFVRRHQGPVLAAALLVLVLVGGIVGTAWGLVQARSAEAAAFNEAGEKSKALAKAEKAEADACAALGKERYALAVYGVSLADHEWRDGRPGRADRALEGCPR